MIRLEYEGSLFEFSRDETGYGCWYSAGRTGQVRTPHEYQAQMGSLMGHIHPIARVRVPMVLDVRLTRLAREQGIDPSQLVRALFQKHTDNEATAPRAPRAPKKIKQQKLSLFDFITEQSATLIEDQI